MVRGRPAVLAEMRLPITAFKVGEAGPRSGRGDGKSREFVAEDPKSAASESASSPVRLEQPFSGAAKTFVVRVDPAPRCKVEEAAVCRGVTP